MSQKKAALELNFADAEAYDRRIRRFVPGYEKMMNSVLDCLPAPKSHTVILELGCGTGNLSQKILDKSPLCKLVAIDLVEAMVETCRLRLEQYSERAEFLCADMVQFRRLNSFDYVFSNLALHYPETEEKKISVCRNAYQSLRPGGIFSFSVMLIGNSPRSTKRIWKYWELDLLQNGVSREEIDEWYETYHGSDHPVPLSSWFEWLKGLGFKRLELVWEKTIFSTIRAKKP